MFEIRVKHKFTARHALTNYNGATEESHSHEWLCEAFIRSENLDEAGCAVDFIKVDEALSEVTSKIEGSDINAHLFFKEKSPSAENVAFFIFRELESKIDTRSAKLVRVTISEDPDHAASFIRE